LKIDIIKVIKNNDNITANLVYNEANYFVTIKKETDFKKISLPFVLGNQLPLQNFTIKPLSRIRLLIKLKDTNNFVSDGLKVNRDMDFKKKAIKEALWLNETTESIEINSNILFDFAKTSLSDLKYLEIT
jgi:hypothetical protein